MYAWRQMTDKQRDEALRLRQLCRHPWHSPPHWQSQTRRYHVIAACYEHAPVIGVSPERLSSFSRALLQTVQPFCEQTHAWVVLPNHYHALFTTLDILSLLAALGRLHGRTSHHWNGEDGRRGRQVWCKAAETGMKFERHFWATMNYIHNNPVRHKCADRWQDWPFGSACDYLDAVGADQARKVWQEYPIGNYDKEWDPVDS